MLSRLNALRARHGILQARIDREMARPQPDELQLTLLKRMKLRLREQIAAIEQRLDDHVVDGQLARIA